jgi:hypothetical protein
MTEVQEAAARRLRRKLEILKLDASKSRGDNCSTTCRNAKPSWTS